MVHQACRADNSGFSDCFVQTVVAWASPRIFLYKRHDCLGLYVATFRCPTGAETLNPRWSLACLVRERESKPLALARLSEKPVKEEEEVRVWGLDPI